MTPAQLHQAHTQGMSEREIDDQEAEDEDFQRVALQAQTPAPAQPHFLRCLGHRNEHLLAAPCQHCRRLTTSIGGDGAISRVPDFVGNQCPLRIQA